MEALGNLCTDVDGPRIDEAALSWTGLTLTLSGHTESPGQGRRSPAPVKGRCEWLFPALYREVTVKRNCKMRPRRVGPPHLPRPPLFCVQT